MLQLIDRGADTIIPGGVLRSLVSYAVKHNLKDIVDKLGGINLSDDGNVIHEIKRDDTLLKSKALIGDVDSMRAILKTGVEVNFKDMNGDTVLACVLDNRDNSHAMEIVKVLLQFGADVNTKKDRWETLLLIAVRMNLENVAELLLELGCDAKAGDLGSCCSLRYAAQNDNGKLTEMLLKFGADASLKTDRDEVTPLHMAVSSNSYHAAFTLLKHGCLGSHKFIRSNSQFNAKLMAMGRYKSRRVLFTISGLRELHEISRLITGRCEAKLYRSKIAQLIFPVSTMFPLYFLWKNHGDFV